MSEHEQERLRSIVTSVVQSLSDLHNPSANPPRRANQRHPEDEINSRFQLPRNSNTNTNAEQTNIRTTPMPGYNPRYSYATSTSASTSRGSTNKSRTSKGRFAPYNTKKIKQSEIVHKDVCLLPSPTWKTGDQIDVIKSGFYVDAFKLDKMWDEKTLSNWIAALFAIHLMNEKEDTVRYVGLLLSRKCWYLMKALSEYFK